MSIDITCGKCGEKITSMKMLKPLRDVMGQYKSKCPFCGEGLSTSEFTLDVDKR